MNFRNHNFLLGSASPRRKYLLELLGVNFRTMHSNTAEIAPEHLTRGDIATYLAEEKANALLHAAEKHEILLTADTIVWVNDTLLGKPGNRQEAFEMLIQLNGNTHHVYTGVCLIHSGKMRTLCVQSDVTFKSLSDSVLFDYIDTFKPFDKAGSYGAQECLSPGYNPCSQEEKTLLSHYGREDFYESFLPNEKTHVVTLIDSIEGSYFNVMGLPIAEIEKVLQDF